MHGTYVSNSTDAITFSDGGANITKKLDPKATVTLNGKPAKLGDLKPGDEVSLSPSEPFTSVAATR